MIRTHHHCRPGCVHPPFTLGDAVAIALMVALAVSFALVMAWADVP